MEHPRPESNPQSAPSTHPQGISLDPKVIQAILEAAESAGGDKEFWAQLLEKRPDLLKNCLANFVVSAKYEMLSPELKFFLHC